MSVVRSFVGAIVDVLLGRLLLALVLGIPTIGVVFILAGGTDLLVWAGLSRSVAGSIAAGLAIIASVAGLAAFGYYAIDW